jgi:DNA adenine methylase Dam
MWAGSKDRDYPKLRKYIPSFNHYYEPFAGSGAVYFKLLAERGRFVATLNDLNADLMCAYVVIRDNPQFLITNLPAVKDRNIYVQMRSLVPINDEERALRFLYLNRNSFFGLGGWMNADRYAPRAIMSRIRYFSPLMAETQFLSGSYEHVMFVDSPQSFIFVDPPYPNANNNACYKQSVNDTVQLNIDCLNRLRNSSVSFFFVSYAHPTLVDWARLVDEPIQYQVLPWKFRRPGKTVQKSAEIYVWRNPTINDTASEFFK